MSTATETCPVGIEQELELTFLATGDFQHVFTRTGDDDGSWVYKIPAAFGFILPFARQQRFYWPESIYEKVVWFTLTTLPSGLERRMSRRRFSAADAPPAGIAGAVRRTSQRLAAIHCRRVRKRQFQRMLDVVDYVVALGLDDILLPRHVARLVAARLRVDGQTHAYRGPLLLQRKAALFEEGLDLATFNWQDLVDAQHRLWRHGVGQFGCLEILGARSWSLLDGSVCLADTSALTRDRRRIRCGLEQAMRDESFVQALRMLQAAGCGGSAEDYLNHLRGQINPDRFDQLWCTESK